MFSDRRQCRECFSRSRSHSSFRFWLPDMGMLSTAGYVGGSAGAVSTVAAIALILCSRDYKDFFYRLYLDIAFSALVFSVTLVGYYMQPPMAVDHNTQRNSASQPEPVVAILFLALNTFSASMVALVSCWLSLHVVLMVMWGVATLKKRPFECGMLLTVLTISLCRAIADMLYVLFTIRSTPNRNVCETFHESLILVITGASVFGVVFVIIAAGVLIGRSFCSTQLNGRVRMFYRQALRETIPFLLLQLCGSLFTVISINIPFPIYHVHGETDVVSITLLLYPCSFVLLPLLLLCQSQITHNLKCRRERERVRGRGRGREDEDRLETATSSYWSTAVTSRTQFIVPPESTETDPLIITQDTGTTVE